MDARTGGRASELRPVFVGLAVLVLLGSIGLNAVLYRRAVETSRELATLRLDPTRAARFDDANRQLSPPAAGESRIVYFGDSRIEYWGGLPAVPGAQSVNRGCGGETTAQLLLRLERDVIALVPRVVVLQMGINDLKEIGLLPGREGAITAACMQNADSVIARLNARGIHAVVLTVFPVGRVSTARRAIWSDRTRAAVTEVNRHLRGLQGPGITVIDCDPLFARGDRMDSRYELDTLHLNPAAYIALNELLQPALAGLVGAPAGRE